MRVRVPPFDRPPHISIRSINHVRHSRYCLRHLIPMNSILMVHSTKFTMVLYLMRFKRPAPQSITLLILFQAPKTLTMSSHCPLPARVWRCRLPGVGRAPALTRGGRADLLGGYGSSPAGRRRALRSPGVHAVPGAGRLARGRLDVVARWSELCGPLDGQAAG
jgi:hypothetical protein